MRLFRGLRQKLRLMMKKVKRMKKLRMISERDFIEI